MWKQTIRIVTYCTVFYEFIARRNNSVARRGILRVLKHRLTLVGASGTAPIIRSREFSLFELGEYTKSSFLTLTVRTVLHSSLMLTIDVSQNDTNRDRAEFIGEEDRRGDVSVTAREEATTRDAGMILCSR